MNWYYYAISTNYKPIEYQIVFSLDGHGGHETVHVDVPIVTQFVAEFGRQLAVSRRREVAQSVAHGQL